MHVKLCTAEGQFVVTGEIPPFPTPPAVLIWGQRFFQFHHQEATPQGGIQSVYYEASTYVLVTETQPPSA